MNRSREFGPGLLAMAGCESLGQEEMAIGVVGMGLFVESCIHFEYGSQLPEISGGAEYGCCLDHARDLSRSALPNCYLPSTI